MNSWRCRCLSNSSSSSEHCNEQTQVNTHH